MSLMSRSKFGSSSTFIDDLEVLFSSTTGSHGGGSYDVDAKSKWSSVDGGGDDDDAKLKWSLADGGSDDDDAKSMWSLADGGSGDDDAKLMWSSADRGDGDDATSTDLFDFTLIDWSTCAIYSLEFSAMVF